MARRKQRTRIRTRTRAKAHPAVQTGGRPGRRLGIKAQFVLSKPREMPASEVVEAAAREGIELTTTLVHAIRSRHRGRVFEGPVSEEASAEPGPDATGDTTGAGPYPSASAFIRAMPLEMPSSEVVEAASRQGIKINPSLVRVVRHSMKRTKSARARPTASGRRELRPAEAVAQPAPPDEVRFRKLVVEIGMTRAKALMAEFERKVEALMVGR